MEVGSHRESIILGKLHKPLGFGLVCIPIRMCAAMRVRVIAVHIDVIGISTSGTIDSIVATIIGAIRVGVREDENVQLVHQVDDTAVSASTKFVDKAKQ